MSNYGKKKSILKKANEVFRKAVATTLAAGVLIGLPGYYNYGTIKQADVKVTDFDFGHWDDTGEKLIADYKFRTDKGTFADKDSWLHLKTSSKTEEIWKKVDRNKTYRITYYGVDFGPFERNILSAREVTEEELKTEAEAKKKMQTQAALQVKEGKASSAGQQPVTGAVQGAQTSVLSGRVVTYDVVTADGRNSIQLTVPVEAVGKVTVNAVTPLQTAPQPPRPGM